jgi:hypothetical protein
MDWYASDNTLRGAPRGSRKKPNAGRSPTCHLWTASANSHMPCSCRAAPWPWEVAFRTAFVVAWHGHGMVCMNQTWPHCVNQMGKTQSKPSAAQHGRGTAWARHGMCELALTRPKPVLAYSTSVRMALDADIRNCYNQSL